MQTPAAAQSWGPSPRSALCHLVSVFILHYDSENSDTPMWFFPQWIFLTYEVVTLCDNMTLGYCFNTWSREEGLQKKYSERSAQTTYSFFCATKSSEEHSKNSRTMWISTTTLGFYERQPKYAEKNNYEQHTLSYTHTHNIGKNTKLAQHGTKVKFGRTNEKVDKEAKNFWHGVYLHTISALLNAIFCFE